MRNLFRSLLAVMALSPVLFAPISARQANPVGLDPRRLEAGGSDYHLPLSLPKRQACRASP